MDSRLRGNDKLKFNRVLLRLRRNKEQMCKNHIMIDNFRLATDQYNP